MKHTTDLVTFGLNQHARTEFLSHGSDLWIQFEKTGGRVYVHVSCDPGEDAFEHVLNKVGGSRRVQERTTGKHALVPSQLSLYITPGMLALYGLKAEKTYVLSACDTYGKYELIEIKAPGRLGVPAVSTGKVRTVKTYYTPQKKLYTTSKTKKASVKGFGQSIAKYRQAA